MDTAQYLDAIKAELKIESDYALQAVLGVTKQAISHYRRKTRTFDLEVAERVAAVLKVHVLEVHMNMSAQAVEGTTADQRWKLAKVFRALAPTAGQMGKAYKLAIVGAIATSIAGFGWPPPANAATLPSAGYSAETMCIM